MHFRRRETKQFLQLTNKRGVRSNKEQNTASFANAKLQLLQPTYLNGNFFKDCLGNMME